MFMSILYLLAKMTVIFFMLSVSCESSGRFVLNLVAISDCISKAKQSKARKWGHGRRREVEIR
jgi:hypothetical protein